MEGRIKLSALGQQLRAVKAGEKEQRPINLHELHRFERIRQAEASKDAFFWTHLETTLQWQSLPIQRIRPINPTLLEATCSDKGQILYLCLTWAHEQQRQGRNISRLSHERVNPSRVHFWEPLWLVPGRIALVKRFVLS